MKKKILGVNLLLVVITAMVAAGCGPLLGVKKAEESYYVLTDNERIPDERLPASRARLPQPHKWRAVRGPTSS